MLVRLDKVTVRHASALFFQVVSANRVMSALGQKRTCAVQRTMSAKGQ
jgi:hypothetical protein